MSQTERWREDVGQVVLLAGTTLKGAHPTSELLRSLSTRLDTFRRRSKRHAAFALFVPGASAFSEEEDLADLRILVGVALAARAVDEAALAISRDDVLARLRALPPIPPLAEALGCDCDAPELHLIAVGPAGSAHLSRASGASLVWTHASSPCRIRMDVAPAPPSFDEHYSAEMPWVHWVPGTPMTAWLGDPRANEDGSWLLSARSF